MARVKKENVPVSLRMEKQTYGRLAEFCEESGQSKTVAIERAINLYVDDYNKKMERVIESINKPQE